MLLIVGNEIQNFALFTFFFRVCLLLQWATPLICELARAIALGMIKKFVVNERESDFCVKLAMIGDDLEDDDDLENPVDCDFRPETALSSVYLGLDHPA